jgi:MEDS: MEthanogen/methylotroph, DcmR Sensory domain
LFQVLGLLPLLRGTMAGVNSRLTATRTASGRTIGLIMARAHLERANAFWAEMSACEHFVQIYEAEEVFMDILASFVSEALKKDHVAVVIATPAHRQELNERLMESGHDLAALRLQDQLISLDAEEMIRKFMANGWADDELFFQLVADILARATKNGRKVRAFGEMVTVMWAKGFYGAAVRLEHLWHRLCAENSFTLFCAYPKIGFAENGSEAIAHICAAHSKILAA